MTTEQTQYGAGWIRCVRCGVHDAGSTRTYNRPLKLYLCTDPKRCDHFRKHMGTLAPSLEHLKSMGLDK